MALCAQAPLRAERVQQIVEKIGEAFDAQGLAVAVVQDGKVLAEAAYGERAAGQPMTPATLCNIASCSKAFTAAAITMLVDDGLLQLDDKVVEHVPEFRLEDPWITANMTVRDLLCHRCGLATFAGDLLWYATDYDDAEVMRRMAKLPIEHPFRGQFGYQNLMYLVAGVVIERKTGLTWQQFVQQRLLTPLGMTNSRPAAQDLAPDAERALPHIAGEAVPDHEFLACKPAASIYSSVHELTAWMRMLLAGGRWQGKSLVSKAGIQAMWRPHTPQAAKGSGPSTEDFRSYGLGWFLSVHEGNKLVEHDGGMPGFISKVTLIPSARFGFAVLTNSDDGVLNETVKYALLRERSGADGLAVLPRLKKAKEFIKRRSERDEAKRVAARRTGTSPSRELQHYAGRYEDEVYGPAEVTFADDRLSLVLLPSKRRLYGKLEHWHDDTFRVDFPDRFLPFALISFEFEPNGDLRGMRLDCPIADFDFGALDFRLQR